MSRACAHTHTQTHTHTHTHRHNHTCTINLHVQHEKKVLDELQLEHLQKKQLLDKATELLDCLDKGSKYEWAPDQVGHAGYTLQALSTSLSILSSCTSQATVDTVLHFTRVFQIICVCNS